MPSCKAGGPISFQRERGGAGENQFGDLLSCDGSQKDAVAKVTRGQDKIVQIAVAQNRQMIGRVRAQSRRPDRISATKEAGGRQSVGDTGRKRAVASFGVLARSTNGTFRGPREHLALQIRLSLALGGGQE